MNVSPKEPIGRASTGATCSSALLEDVHPSGERTSESPADLTSIKKSAATNHLLPPIIPQNAIEDEGTGIAPVSTKRSNEIMLHNMAMAAAGRVNASANPCDGLGLGIGTCVTTATTRLPHTELQMRQEMLLLQEQQRLVEQEMLQQRLLIAEQRHREGMELLALRGDGSSAAGEALQRELVKVEAEEARLKRLHHHQQQRQQVEGNSSLLRLQQELALAEEARAIERARQMRETLMLAGNQPHQVHQHVVGATTATTGLQDPPNTATASAGHPSSPYPAKRAKRANTNSSAAGGAKKKRKVGRPIGSSAKAKERSKQLADARRLFQTDSRLLGMDGLCPSDDFTMSPEVAASILEVSTSGAGSARSATANSTRTANACPAATDIATAHTNCWIDPTPHSTSMSTFILPCSRQPGALLQAPSLDSYHSQWSAIQSSLTNDTRLSPNSRQMEALDQFLHDARFAGVPIQNDTSIAGRFGVNSQGQVLQRMEVDGHIARRVGFDIGSQQQQQQQQQQQAQCAVVAPKQQAESPKQDNSQQAESPKQDDSQPPTASESKVSEYLTSTPNMMVLPLQQRLSLPRMA